MILVHPHFPMLMGAVAIFSDYRLWDDSLRGDASLLRLMRT